MTEVAGPEPITVFGLSGPIGVGKTTLGRALQAVAQVPLVGVSDKLREIAELRSAGGERATLAAIGDELWRSEPSWYVDLIVATAYAAGAASASVDAVRRMAEIEALRADSRVRTLHIFLTAPFEVLVKRFASRGSATDYRTATSHPSESALPRLKEIADLALDSSHLSVEQEVRTVLERSGEPG